MNDMRVDLTDAVERIAAGEIPAAIDELTAIGRGIARVNARHAQTLAVIVAEGRAQYDLTGDVAGWTKWCADEFALSDVAYRSHLLAVGKMLSGLLKCGTQHYKRAFDLSHDSQYALTAVWKLRGDAGIVTFFKLYPDAGTMSRDVMREAVDTLLGRAKAPSATQPELALEFDALGMIDEQRLDEVVRSEQFDDTAACAMTYNGLNLCRAALPRLEQCAADLDLDVLEDIEKGLTAAREQIAHLVTVRKKNILGL